MSTKLQNILFSFSTLTLNLAVITTGLLVYRVGPFKAQPVRSYSNVPIVSELDSFNRISTRPNRIVIDSLNIDLDVANGSFNRQNQRWSIDNSNAFYADVTSPLTNISGHTLIYGHNTPQVFSKLHDLSGDAKVVVYSQDGYIFEYQYESQTSVAGDANFRFAYLVQPRLSLQTCTGNWNEKRQILQFKLIDWYKND